MKAMVRLALSVCLLAGAVSLPTTAQESGGILLQPGTANKLRCAQFCAVVLCASPQTCGLYTDANGTLQCGCHGSGIGTVE